MRRFAISETLEKLIDDLRGGLNTDAKTVWYEKTAQDR